MVEAGKEEKRLAEDRGDYHKGVPAIIVVVDIGWSNAFTQTLLQCVIRCSYYHWEGDQKVAAHWCTQQVLHCVCSECAQGKSPVPHELGKIFL